MDFNMMENSKTGKAAEADLIIGIGKDQKMILKTWSTIFAQQ